MASDQYFATVLTNKGDKLW